MIEGILKIYSTPIQPPCTTSMVTMKQFIKDMTIAIQLYTIIATEIQHITTLVFLILHIVMLIINIQITKNQFTIIQLTMMVGLIMRLDYFIPPIKILLSIANQFTTSLFTTNLQSMTITENLQSHTKVNFITTILREKIEN